MPKARLTKSVIDKLPFQKAGVQVCYFDETLPGFGLRVGATKKTFFVQKDINGKTTARTIGVYGILSPDQAREEAREKLYLLSKGIDPDEERRKARLKVLTLDQLAEEFFKSRKNMKPRTRSDYRRTIDKYLADWRDKPITDITDEKFYARYTEIGEKNGPTMANNVRRILSSILNYGIAAHRLFDRNPVQYIASTKSAYPNKRRDNYIKPAQLSAWYQAVNNLPNRVYRDYLLLVIFTGLRRNEAAGLEWQYVDFEARTLTIPETKNGDPLTLPMTDFIHDLLGQRRELVKDSPYVFPGPGTKKHLAEPKKALEAVTKATGIEFTVHDLRRSFVTYAESLDISQYALKAMLNHRASDITASYIILDVERLRAPMEKVSTYIQEMMVGE